uniref:Transport and golgi organization 6 homolog n=1 Tax=Sinocyclocheilus grahami TaxID=75366 RepID=A0A672PGP2_SINGR
MPAIHFSFCIQVVGFIVSMLQRACVSLKRGTDSPVESQTLSMGMGLVATLLSGALTADDYSSMDELLPHLEQISQKHPEPVIQELASDLRATIATHGAYRPKPVPKTATQHSTTAGGIPDCGNSEPSSSKAFSEWLLEACDPDVPSRAVALRSLTRSVRDRDKEALQNKDKLLTLFLENLEHEDSFVYLSAIQGLAVLADSFPEQILQRLLGEYQTGATVGSPKRERSLETRLKVGEVLMRASRLTPHYGRPLIGVSVRASSFSNLGELCQCLNFSLGPLAQEVLSTCLTALIKMDKEAEVRRAAVHVIALVLRGLSDKTTQVLGDVLLELYRALKWVVRSDPDEVAVIHAQLALEELNDVMRRFIFPQQKLEKKIVVLP